MPRTAATYPLSREDRAELLRRFIYHAPKGKQPDRYVALRSKAVGLARLIMAETPPGYEQDEALKKVEEAVFWANAAIARRE